MKQKIATWLNHLLEANDVGPSLKKVITLGLFFLFSFLVIKYAHESPLEWGILVSSVMLTCMGLYTFKVPRKKATVPPNTTVA